MKFLLLLIRSLLFVFHLLLGMIIASLFFHRENRDYRHHKEVIRLWLKLPALLFGCRLQITSDNPQTLTAIDGSLLVANHISWLDIFVLGGIFNIRFLSKSEIRSWPMFGWLSTSSGTLFIERGKGSEQSNEMITDVLLQGDNVMIFPEATTSDGLSVKPFHPRLFKSAIAAQKPVIPVMISYLTNHRPNRDIAWTLDRSFLQTLRYTLGSWRTEVQVHCFAPVNSEGLSRKELARRCHVQIRERLESRISPDRRQA